MARYLHRLPQLLLSTNTQPQLINKNAMSVFASYYIEPTFKKDKLKEVFDLGEAEKLASVPVKPPLAYQSCSRFQDASVSKFINIIMKQGKKSLARGLVEKAFENIKRTQIERYHLATDPKEKESIELDPLVIFHKAVENCRPVVMLTPVRRGGVKYQVPVAVREKWSYFMAYRWIKEATIDRERKTILFPEQLAWEILDAASNRGKVIKRKQDLHRQCENNRAYAHYKWI